VTNIPYSLDQTLLSVSHLSEVVATPPDILDEIVIVAILEY